MYKMYLYARNHFHTPYWVSTRFCIAMCDLHRFLLYSAWNLECAVEVNMHIIHYLMFMNEFFVILICLYFQYAKISRTVTQGAVQQVMIRSVYIVLAIS